VFDVGSAASQAGTAADVHVGNGTFALHAGGGGRRSGNMDTPLGEIDNSQSRNGFGNVGLSWTGAKGFFGGSYGYDDTRYGIPFVEGGQIQLTPRRHAFTLRGGAQGLGGAFDAFRASLAHRRYAHEELVGDDVGTEFRNTTTELQVMAGHRAIGRLKGSVGGWAMDRGFNAIGEEALSPPVDERGFAAFVYEEVTWPHVTFQFGGRVDHTRFAPLGEAERAFTNPSGSFGLLLRPAGAGETFTVALSVAHAARNPSLEELFFFGPHPGNFAFEVGNPELSSEKAFGIDLSLRWRAKRASGELTFFRNAIRDYIFSSPLTPEEFETREGDFSSRFGGRAISPAGHEHGEGVGEEGVADEAALQFAEYLGSDSVLQGVEAHTDVQITSRVSAELGLDVVRGRLRASNEPLPRIPPVRVRGGLRYQYNAFQAGGEVVGVARQDRVFGAEPPTDAYSLLKLFAAYSFPAGGVVNTLTFRVDNATNELYRNHLSRIKEQVPEMGRGVRLLYSVQF
jgi:iron complex outermembrane receptor protein